MKFLKKPLKKIRLGLKSLNAKNLMIYLKSSKAKYLAFSLCLLTAIPVFLYCEIIDILIGFFIAVVFWTCVIIIYLEIRDRNEL